MFITMKNISKSFGSHAAVDNVSCEISKGKLIGLFGPSGDYMPSVRLNCRRFGLGMQLRC